VPIKYIGVGEKIEQLQLFNKKAFIFHDIVCLKKLVTYANTIIV
jgi:signal recognition particle GTPase